MVWALPDGPDLSNSASAAASLPPPNPTRRKTQPHFVDAGITNKLQVHLFYSLSIFSSPLLSLNCNKPSYTIPAQFAAAALAITALHNATHQRIVILRLYHKAARFTLE
ncbi:hypothetical protein TSUD_253950 [Trifolium subterraneum]|uniref:Uncharacterized protein n=1 Tax=Trifolium subterraneum TaxID=3900 RepID=A0A2Z6P8P7_TRISU|nr:hypothetical protein TSUD_253950 [Trifolium subterraneum]